MAKCSNNGDCDRDNYVCRSAEQLNQVATETGTRPRRAEVLDDNKNGKFCVVRE